MAFVYMAPRASSVPPSATGTLGPGTYTVPSSTFRNQRPGYAPFSTTSKRHDFAANNRHERRNGEELPAASETSEGHQSYTNEPAHKTGPSGVFSSGTKRFNDADAKIPGPGQYTVPTSIKSKRKQRKGARNNNNNNDYGRTNQQNNNKYMTLLTEIFKEANPTAPSIPCSHQAYGYDADTRGRLQMQRAPSQLHEDVISSQPEVAFAHTSKSRSINSTAFGKSKTQRTDFTKDKQLAPGPGTYETSAAYEAVSRNDVSCAASFKSTSKRHDLTGNKMMCPGPGAYSQTFTHPPAKTNVAHQFFGSTTKRFSDEDSMDYDSTPGPGSYTVARTNAYGLTQPGVLVKGNSAAYESGGGGGGANTAAVFLSSAARFARTPDPEYGDEVPGVGTYTTPSLVQDMGKRVSSRTGIFGSTTRRFPKESSGGSEDGPGPGTYGIDSYSSKHQRNTNVNVSQRGLSSFASASERGDPNAAAAQNMPDPGAYNVNLNWTEVYKSKSNPKGYMLSTHGRFTQTKESKRLTPGPGSYDNNARDMVQAGNKGVSGDGRNKNKQYGSQAPRFTGASSDVRPGPGQYDVRSDFNKKTFNIAFMED